MDDARRWIETLALQAHPEGGWYREIYRASESIPHAALPARFTGDRVFSTAIYFLLRSPERSALHRIRQDELWHFYAGSTLTLHVIDRDGRYDTRTLGNDPDAGESLVAVVPAGALFGATVEAGTYALAGCTVAPGFDFDDFEMPDRAALLGQYPELGDLIERLTAPPRSR